MLTLKEPPLQERPENLNLLFQDVKNLFVEYGLASGGDMPSRGNLAALHRHGYLSLTPPEVLKICQCEDYEDLAQLMRPWYEDETASRQTEEMAILEEIEQARTGGLVPEILFLKVERARSQERQAIADSVGKKYNDIGIITQEEVGPKEKIERYKKYQLVCRLLADTVINGEPVSWTGIRKIGIAMGINLDEKDQSGNLQARGFKKELCKANTNLSEELIEFEAGLDFDEIFPEYVAEGRKQLLAASEDKEYYYDKTNCSVLLGRLALKERELITGNRKGIIALGRILVQNSVDLNVAVKNRYRYRHWQREDFTDYGYMLLEALEKTGEELNLDILTRASRLGIGPGPTVIRNEFGSLPKFYQHLPMEGASHHGLFTNWAFNDYVAHIAKIATENDGKVSKEIIDKRIADGAIEPSFSHISRQAGPLEVLMPAASLEPPKTKLTPWQCLEAGLRHTDAHGGVIPSYAEIETSPDLPSETPIRRCFGSIPEYQRQLRELLAERDRRQELELAA